MTATYRCEGCSLWTQRGKGSWGVSGSCGRRGDVLGHVIDYLGRQTNSPFPSVPGAQGQEEPGARTVGQAVTVHLPPFSAAEGVWAAGKPCWG